MRIVHPRLSTNPTQLLGQSNYLNRVRLMAISKSLLRLLFSSERILLHFLAPHGRCVCTDANPQPEFTPEQVPAARSRPEQVPTAWSHSWVASAGRPSSEAELWSLSAAMPPAESSSANWLSKQVALKLRRRWLGCQSPFSICQSSRWVVLRGRSSWCQSRLDMLEAFEPAKYVPSDFLELAWQNQLRQLLKAENLPPNPQDGQGLAQVLRLMKEQSHFLRTHSQNWKRSANNQEEIHIVYNHEVLFNSNF